MQKNKKIIIVFVMCLFCIYVVNFFGNNENKIEVSQYSNNQMKYSNALSLMFETAADSGEYIQSSDNVWPTGDYVYNGTLSKCEKGSKISYNETSKKVLVEANGSDKCYVYFDIKPKVLFANYIKGLYTSNGVNNLYLHNNSLENSANDNSIRYAGSGETTNNFVCFGSDATSCENDNLYRIIGVFGDKVKLLKYDYANSNMLGTGGDYNTNIFSKNSFSTYIGSHTTINTYYYNYNGLPNHTGDNQYGSNNWETSLLNKTNLNTNYINYLNTKNEKWSNMISDTIWNIGKSSNTLVNNIVRAEKEVQTSEASKIGLMNASDYGYGTLPSNWSTFIGSYGTATNWICMGLDEWIITGYSGGFSAAFSISPYCGVNASSSTNNKYAIRPVFYLKSEVTYVEGNGSQSSPFRIA